MGGWEELEKKVAEAGEKVKQLKTGGGEKDAVDAAVANLLSVKQEFTKALEAAIAAAPDDATKETLRAKIPPAPKPSKKDKKAEKAAGGGNDAPVDDAKAANIKAAEEAKAAARAKKKAEAEAKAAGAPAAAPKAPAPPAAPAAPAAAAGKPAAAAPPSGAATTAAAAVRNKNLELHFTKEAVPMLAIGTARLAKQEVVLKRVEPKQLPPGTTCLLLLPQGAGRLTGALTIARYFARLAPAAGVASLLYGSPGDAMSAAQVDEFIDSSDVLAAATGPAVADHLATLNRRLAMRATLCGHAISLADLAVWLGLKRNAPAEQLAAKGGAGPHLKRWLKFVEASPACVYLGSEFFGVQKDAGSMDGMTLTGAEMGKVVTRFPPEPSGHLHIGHVKAALLNSYYASRYQGKMLLRFDDTNPSKEKEEYEEAIVKDLARLNIKPASVSHTSDWFEEIKEIAYRMIKEGIAYVDPSPQEEQQKLRFDKKDGPFRNATVEENLRLFDEMHKGSEEGLKCCLRAKINMQSNNGSMRDPTIYRCNLVPHAQTKDKYKAYPTYDLACPIVDALEGVTHALRDSQYSDRKEQYRWFLKALRLRTVELEDFSRVNFVKTLLSKRKLQWLIDNKMAEDWDDARFPTVAGILRRGMTVEGLKNFILSMGATKNNNLMSWDKIWNFNLKVIDPISPRYMALMSDGIVKLTLSGAPKEAYFETLYRHPKDESLGKKVRAFAPTVLIGAEDAGLVAEGEEVTLMSWGNVIIKSVTKDASGVVTALAGELNLAGDVKKTKKKLTWLADTPDLVSCELVDLDFLIQKDKPEEDDKLTDILTEKSYFPYKGVGEASLRTLKRGDTIQVERRGFYICDAPYVRPEDPVRLYFVPDGKNLYGVLKK